MFRTQITTTPFVSNYANTFFSKISGDSYFCDESFLSTLRALVFPRMKENDSLSLVFRESNMTDTIYAFNSISNDLRRQNDGTMFVCNIISNNGEKIIDMANDHFCRENEGWYQLDKVMLFFKKQFYTRCFVNPDRKMVLILADNMDIRKFHYLQCGIFAFLPWYFNPEDGVSEIEMELINSLREKTHDKYADCIARMAEKYDFKTENIRNLLGGFETRFERIECDKTREKILSIIQEIRNYNMYIRDCLKNKSELETKLLGLETKIEQSGGNSEIMEYFLGNNSLVLESANDSQVTFGVRDYITFFNEDMAKSMIENKSSYVYKPRGRACNNIIPEEDMEKLMTAIFIDQKLRIRFCAAYRFYIDGGINAIMQFNYGYEYKDCMPNTHIDEHACLGSYYEPINKFLMNRDYIGAIEQCIASCRSLNFADSIVMAEFMCRLYGIGNRTVNTKCIELPDGRVVKPKEAIEYLKQEESENA